MPTIALPGDLPYVLIEAGQRAELAAMADREIIDLYKEHGALLFRGFDHNLELFGQFADRFCATSVQNDSHNRALLDSERNIQSVNRGRQSFPLHPELSREPWKPDVCFFYCAQPARAGGKTTICDGVAIVDRLPADMRTKMAGRELTYIQLANDKVLEYWLGKSSPSDSELAHPPAGCPFTFERFGDQVGRIFSRPLLHRPMFHERLAFGNFLLFARLQGVSNFPLLDDRTPVPADWMDEVKRVSDSLTAPIEWRTGDLLMLDNSRFMHGRTAVVDERQRSIGTRFGYLNFAEPGPDKPADEPWRRPGFRPPQAVEAS